MCMQNLRRALLGLSVATLVVVGTAVGGPFEDGVAAYQRGDYAIALQSYRKAADQGDARAQNNLGAMYENGQGVPKDFVEAVKWYHKAAEQGAASAEYALGACYADGIGVAQDLVEAYKWVALAASHGQKNAATFNDTLAKKLTADQKAKAQQLVQSALASSPPAN